MKAFKNAKVYVEGKGVITTNLTFDKTIISTTELYDNCEVISLPQDAVVLPGFIDQHIHGAGGCDAMDGTFEALSTIANTRTSDKLSFAPESRRVTSACAPSPTDSMSPYRPIAKQARSWLPSRNSVPDYWKIGRR